MQFTSKRVAYLAHASGLRSRYDRPRDYGMPTSQRHAALCNYTPLQFGGLMRLAVPEGTLPPDAPRYFPLRTNSQTERWFLSV